MGLPTSAERLKVFSYDFGSNLMQIIIPMSGFGERFRSVGYDLPKYLLEVEGRPIISHVIGMFPGELDFIFICNEDHLNSQSYNLRAILNQYCPSGKIISIPPHELGPINAICVAEDEINLEKPTIVNYCDFSCYWDWNNFKQIIQILACDGAVPAYKGFHPHSLGKTNYAYIKADGNWLLDIKEKEPFTTDRMNEYASSGTYFFSSAQLMLDAFKYVIKNNLHINGEYYVSLAYKYLIAKNKKTIIYPLQHFMQWGTPEDLEEYLYWSKAFNQLALPRKNFHSSGATIMPMAGLGQRFSEEAYRLPKPLIDVSGTPMVIQSVRDLPTTDDIVFVIRNDMQDCEMICKEIMQNFPNAKIKLLDSPTDGQARTAFIGFNELSINLTGPITVGACDGGIIYDEERYLNLLEKSDFDVIVWGVKGYPNAYKRPEMYGWLNVNSESGEILRVSVKVPTASYKDDPIVIGTFTFRNTKIFNEIFLKLFDSGCLVNGEFYIDTCINEAIKNGYKCHYFEVDAFLSWGTPDDLKTFEYWQSCFNKLNDHPYKLRIDSRIPENKQNTMEQRGLKLVPQPEDYENRSPSM